MNRPYSAKQGQGYWGNPNLEDKQQETKHQKLRRNVKLMKPDLTTNDFARILPRKMYKDKERLYSEGLQLKQAFNDVTQQNVRLKTQISMLQKQQEKVGRLAQSHQSSKPSNNKSLIKGSKVQRSVRIVQDLKKMLRECRQQNLQLQNENNKIKKAIKYMKINQLEIELKVVIEENKKLARMIEDYASQLNYDEKLEAENNDLREALEKQHQANKQLQEENQKLIDEQEEIQGKFKEQFEKWKAKENKYLREINLQKRKQIQNQRHIEDLRREIKSLLENKPQSNKKVSRPLSRPGHQKMLTEISVHRRERQSISDQDIARSNQKLQKELFALRRQLQNTKKELQYEKNRMNAKQFSYSEGFDSPQPEDKQNKQKLNQSKLKEQSDINIQAVYDQQFENEENNQNKLGKEDSKNLVKLKKEFQDHSEEQSIFKKQQSASKMNQNKSNRKKKVENKKKTADFKPNKQMLSQIKQLLTYRMKSQRYPFTDLKNDIQSSDTPQFTYADLTNMLVNEPFYLKTSYVKAFLSYCYQRQQIKSTDILSSKIMIQKLRKVIGDFTLLSENEQKQMIIRVAQMTTAYPQQLHIAFQNVKNGQETVAKKDLIQLFKKLQLQDKYIDLIISQLSLCSDDLQHLNFLGFFERFYIGDEQAEDQAIQELREESQESKVNSSRVKKDIKKS